MNIVNKIILALVGVMSLAAGAAKVMRVPDEAQFFAEAGLAPGVMVIFGVVQLVAGALILWRKTRLAGALIAAIMFACSAIMIFMAGNLRFALISSLPVAMALYVAWRAGQTE